MFPWKRKGTPKLHWLLSEYQSCRPQGRTLLVSLVLPCPDFFFSWHCRFHSSILGSVKSMKKGGVRMCVSAAGQFLTHQTPDVYPLSLHFKVPDLISCARASS